MEYDRQEILDKAAIAYDHAEATIRAMDDVFQNVTGSDYSAELTLAQFDMILQGVLFKRCNGRRRFRARRTGLHKTVRYARRPSGIHKERLER